MAITGSPKKMAQDIAEGYMSLSPPMLRPYTRADLQTILTHIGIVSREIRQSQVPLENILLLKARNMRLTRLNRAEVVVRAYCKKQRIAV